LLVQLPDTGAGAGIQMNLLIAPSLLHFAALVLHSNQGKITIQSPSSAKLLRNSRVYLVVRFDFDKNVGTVLFIWESRLYSFNVEIIFLQYNHYYWN